MSSAPVKNGHCGATEARTSVRRRHSLLLEEEFKRNTPRARVEAFLGVARLRDYERAAEYLDFRSLPTGFKVSHGPTLARELKLVLYRALWVDLHTLSCDPDEHADDGYLYVRGLSGKSKRRSTEEAHSPTSMSATNRCFPCGGALTSQFP